MSKDKPKKPLTTYLRFCNQHREKVKQDNPKLKGGAAIIKELSSMWNKLNEDEKKSYAPNYKEEMEDYKTKLAEWKKQNNDDDETLQKRGKSKGKKVERKSEDEHRDEKPKKNKTKKGDHNRKKKEAKEESEKVQKNEQDAKDGNSSEYQLDKEINTLINTHITRTWDCMRIIGLVDRTKISDYINYKEVKLTDKGDREIHDRDGDWCDYDSSSSQMMEHLFVTECKAIQSITSDKTTKFVRTIALIQNMVHDDHWLNDNEEEEEQFQKFLDKIWKLAKDILNENNGEEVKCLKTWCNKLREAIDESCYGLDGECKFKDL